MSDETPDGDDIRTTTLWLTYPDGEGAISVDTSGFDAAIRRAPSGSAGSAGQKEQG